MKTGQVRVYVYRSEKADQIEGDLLRKWKVIINYMH